MTELITTACLTNRHADCSQPRCTCQCHRDDDPEPIVRIAGMPSCGLCLMPLRECEIRDGEYYTCACTQ